MKQDGTGRRILASCRRILATGLLLGAALQGCGDADVAPEPTPGIQGELVVRIADYPDQSSSTHYYLDIGDGEEYELIFQGSPDLTPGTLLRVQGALEDGEYVPRVMVDSFQIVQEAGEGLGVVQEQLANPTKKADFKVAVLLVHWGAPDGETTASMRGKVFSNTNSTSEYFRETSYGIQGLTGEVFGWYSIPNPGSCNHGAIATSARNAAQAAGVDLSGYSQIMYYFPRYSGCGWAGLANVTYDPSRPARDSWYNGYSGCVVLAQELAHNWGLLHSRTCRNQPASGVCAEADRDEYGDLFCPMGGGCYQMNAVQKAEMGWFGGCNIVTANSGGTFDIAPFESPSDGIQALRVPRGGGRYFYIENRRPIGKFDVTRSDATLNTIFGGVLIHEGPEAVPMPASLDNRNPYLIDTTPGTGGSGAFKDAALQPNGTYSSGGVSIKLLSKDASGVAKVQVFVSGGSGAAMCIDGRQYGSTPPPPPPPPPPPTTSSTFKARHSGKCMDVNANGSVDGTNIHQWTCNGSAAQAYAVETVSSGVYRIRHLSSNKCVDISAASTADGANVQLWTCNGTGAQSFRLNPMGAGYYQVQNINSNKCLDVAGGTGATSDGVNIHQWACHTGYNQQWLISGFNACGGATVYPDVNYAGAGVLLPVGDHTLASLTSRGVGNDAISSLRVPSGCSVTLYQHDNYGGVSLLKTTDDPNLVDDPMGTINWNDQASSIRIR